MIRLHHILASLLLSSALAEEWTPQSRYWKHHRQQKTLVVDGVEQWDKMEACLAETITASREELSKPAPNPKLDKKLSENGQAYFVALKDAITPVQAEAVRGLASCVRKLMPSLYTAKRALYKEFGYKHDSGLGGNTPTVVNPIMAIFLPEILEVSYRALELAYNEADWNALTQAEVGAVGWLEHPHPKVRDCGVRVSEHLSYDNFPSLGAHDDGYGGTAYTVNFALTGPDDYEGGELFVRDNTGNEVVYKPEKYTVMAFLGGEYMHGVKDIKGGHREMWSNEFWQWPDVPLGNTLVEAMPDNMIRFMALCDAAGEDPCKISFSDAVRQAKNSEDEEDEDDMSKVLEEIGKGTRVAVYWPVDDLYYPGTVTKDAEEDSSVFPILYDDGDVDRVDLSAVPFHFLTEEDEKMLGRNDQDDDDEEEEGEEYEPQQRKRATPVTSVDFATPPLKPNQIAPLRWKDDNGVVHRFANRGGLPPQLTETMLKYADRLGITDDFRRLLIDGPPNDPDTMKFKQYNGNSWFILRPDTRWNSNMHWIGPNEAGAHRDMLMALSDGGFDSFLESLGETFNLDGIAVYHVGFMAVSQCSVGYIHSDFTQTEGKGLHVIFPLIKADDDAAEFNVYNQDESKVGGYKFELGTAIILGDDTQHATAALDYTELKQMRMAVSIYLADINEENAESIADEYSAYDLPEGDPAWILSQAGMHWSRSDPTRKLPNSTAPASTDGGQPTCAAGLDGCSEAKVA